MPRAQQQVRRDDDTHSFISGRDDVEKQFTAQLACGNIAELVKDQQVQCRQSSLESFQSSVVPRFDHLRDLFVALVAQLGDAKEFHLLAQRTRLDSEGRRQVRLDRP